MRLKKRPPTQKKGAPYWMVTYSDMITLILVFFVLLFGMSQIDIQKFEAIAQSFRERGILDFYPSAIPSEQSSFDGDLGDLSDLGIVDEGKPGKGGDGEGDGAGDGQDAAMNQLVGEINKYIEESGYTDIAIATRTERGVVLVLPEQIMFESGEAEIIDEALPFLERMATLLKSIPNVVKVEGHTDNRPISRAPYPSNWELSTARASSVIRYFIENHGIDSTRFIATGYSDTRPVAPNDGPENWQKNRRVEIVITDPTYAGENDNLEEGYSETENSEE